MVLTFDTPVGGQEVGSGGPWAVGCGTHFDTLAGDLEVGQEVLGTGL